MVDVGDDNLEVIEHDRCTVVQDDVVVEVVPDLSTEFSMMAVAVVFDQLSIAVVVWQSLLLVTTTTMLLPTQEN